MTFLNPLALLGLLAAAIPILLHLLNLRKLRTIEFSTLAFLKELEKTKIRRLKLRQILLLILRTLLVVLMVLAFSRPTLKGSMAGSVGSHARTSAVFLIDDSYSMTTEDQHGELLKQARQTMKDLTQLFSEGDEIFLLRLSTITNPDSSERESFREFSTLRRHIDNIKPSAVYHPLEEGLRVAARLLASVQNFNKEIYVISDFQAGVIGNDAVTPSPGRLFSAETRLFLVSLGMQELRNFGIEAITVPSTVFGPHKPFTLQARIGNYTGTDVQDRVISVFLNGTRVAERSIDIPRHSAAPVEFSVSADSTGDVKGFVELEHDDVEFDNRRFFALHIPKRTNVLLIGTRESSQMALLALTARTGDASEIEVEEANPSAMSSVAIKRSHVIVLSTTQGLLSGQVSEISAFVKGGGGVMFFPSASIDPATFNNAIAQGFGLPRLDAIDRSTSTKDGTGSFLEFDKANLNHPIFEGIFESSPGAQSDPGAGTSSRKLESPRISTSVRFGLTTSSNVIISMTNGSPFLFEQGSGTGRFLVFAVPPTPSWSDFPTRGLFVPLLHRAVLYLAHQHAGAPEESPGSEILLRTNSAPIGPWDVLTPEQSRVSVTPVLQLYHQTFRYRETEQAGIYTLLAGGRPVQNFVINLDPRESQTSKATPRDEERMLQRLGIAPNSATFLEGNNDLQGKVLASRFGVELWKIFLTLALIIAVIELFLAKTWKRELPQSILND